jgi:cytochrome c oxidase cbb3-type subunit 3
LKTSHALSQSSDDAQPRPAPSVAARFVILGAVALVSVAAVVFVVLKTPPSPPPPEIAADPLLVEGRELYLARCVSCHGVSGRGDGPIAKGLAGPPVGDLSDKTWKHGDRPEQVLAVVSAGVRDTAMPGWKAAFGPDGVRAASAYVYYLAGRDVPEELRKP